MAREQHSGNAGGKGGTGLGRFLRARRARVTPTDVGLPEGPGLRRTPGLRREELATLAGVSIDYYTRLERGKETNPSPSVVDALAAALRLDGTEREHLRDLAARAARAARAVPELPTAPGRCGHPGGSVDPGVELLLESMRPNPAHVVSRTMDMIAANPGGLRLMAGLEDWPGKQRNIVRYVFLHPAARALFDDWENQIRGCVARLRTLAGTDPDAPDLVDLVDELLLKSPDFARLWEAYDVKGHSSGRKTFHHPRVGDVTFGYQSMTLEGTDGHRLVAYHAPPGTPEYDAMLLLDTAGEAGEQPARRAGAGRPAAG
ncbi:helix-turn-helix transcriptional regulator [Streptomyces mirabilis]|uniref:helix-turn-helix transcriptional regulator n=1 Tax=Streptomyces mirabilis TaxID=68239 RepID=UPI0033A2880E